MIIPQSYYKKQLNVKLTASEIQIIIDELERTEHNIYRLLGYEEIIKKLEKVREKGK